MFGSFKVTQVSEGVNVGTVPTVSGTRQYPFYAPVPPPNLSPTPLPMTWSVWMTTCSWGISTSLTSARSVLSRSWSRIDSVRSSGTLVPSLFSEGSS